MIGGDASRGTRGCPSFPIDRLEACPTRPYQASGAAAGLTSPAWRDTHRSNRDYF